METATTTVLRLQLPTDPRWANLAATQLEDILTDHAWCEQKAASACISLIVQYPQKQKLVEVLTPVVAEEWEHFAQVLEQLNKRGFTLGKARKDEYVNEVHKQLVRKGGSPENQLTDRLLFCALIEARSCERFKVLWKNLNDAELQQFYYELMVSEAGHYVNFISLAREYDSREAVDARWQEFLHVEAKILQKLTPRADRMH